MKSKDRSNPPEHSSRRRFTKAVAAALVSTPLASAVSLDAQTPTTPKQSPAPPTAPSPPATNSPKPSPVAEAYAEVARARFGERVTPEEFAKIKNDIENSVRAAERLRAFKLQNADEPDFVFSA